jgi:hypothetical protein
MTAGTLLGRYREESSRGELPAECPAVVLDRSARLVLHLAGTQPGALHWAHAGAGKKGEETDRLRVKLELTAERPCLVHGNGATKGRMPDLWKMWSRHEDEKARPVAHRQAARRKQLLAALGRRK